MRCTRRGGSYDRSPVNILLTMSVSEYLKIASQVLFSFITHIILILLDQIEWTNVYCNYTFSYVCLSLCVCTRVLVSSSIARYLIF